MSEPDRNLVAVICAGGPPEDPEKRTEVLEVNGAGALSMDEVIAATFAAIGPQHWEFEDIRRQSHWGASSLQVQEILILIGTGVPSQVAAAALIAALQGLSRAWSTTGVRDADAAWRAFERVLVRDFKVADASVQEVNKTEGAWLIVARAGNKSFDGLVTKDGRVVHARRRVSGLQAAN